MQSDTARNHRRLTLALLRLMAASALLLAAVAFLAMQNADRLPWLKPEVVPELFSLAVGMAALSVVVMAWSIAIKPRTHVGVSHVRCALLLSLFAVIFLIDRVVGVIVPPPSPAVSLLQPHPTRGWCLKPGATGTESGVSTRTNSLGLRGPEINEAKPRGVTRVLFIGDSVIFGFSLAEEDTLVSGIQRLLNQRFSNRMYECINAGVSGYATWQERDYLESEGFRLAPDIVVLGFSMQNDVTDAALFGRGVVADKTVAFEFSNSAHWSGLVRAWTRMRAKREWDRRIAAVKWRSDQPGRDLLSGDAFCKIFAEPMRPEFRTGWNRALTELNAIVHGCRSRGIRVAVMLFASKSQFEPACKDVYPQAHMVAWGNENQTAVFDALPAVRAFCASTRKPVGSLFIDGEHPNAEGSRVIAEGFVDFAIERGIVP